LEALYIVGNGFDLHHDLPTTYVGFSEYLKSKNPSIFDILAHVISYPITDDDLWSHFEENLSFIDISYLEDHISEYIPSPSSDDYDRDMDACVLEAQRVVGYLTHELRNEFAEYIRKADSYQVDTDFLLTLDLDAFFISFNFTRTLEKQYGVSAENILYMHGTYDDKENIVLGHAVDPSTFIEEKDDQSPPEGLTSEQLEQWNEEMSNQYVPFLDEAREELSSYYGRSFKNSSEIIETNSSTFNRLGEVRHIFILGHSMSDVDIEYFEVIKEHASQHCQWNVSYYGEKEKAKIEDILLGLGISEQNYTLIELTSLLSKPE